VGGKTRREVLGISPDQDYDLFTIEYVQLNTSEGISVPKLSTGRLPGTDEYGYAMMERGRGATDQAPSASSSRRDRSSTRGSRARSTDQPTVTDRRSRARSTDQLTVTDIYGGGVSRDLSSMGRSRSLLGSRYGISKTPQQRTGSAAVVTALNDDQVYLFNLNIHLPEDIKPLAREYMKALVDNLRESLHEAHHAYSNDLEASLEDAESRRDRARSRFSDAMEQVKAVVPPPEIKQNPADAAVYEQLEQIVDLSMLEAQMSFDEVITVLEQSVDPPLQIQPNWKDLLENAELEQTTPAGVDPLTSIKLRKALEILIASVSNEFSELGYVVDEGVIIISTKEALPSNMVPCVYEIPALAYSAGSAKELADAIQNTIDPESWLELGDAGKGTITPYPRQQPRKLAILQTYENHQKIWEFLQSITIDIPAGTPSDVPVEMLLSEKSNLLREKQNLEMEVARLQGRRPAIDEQIMRIKKEIEEKIQDDQVSGELRKILDLQVKYLEGVKKLVDTGRVSTAEFADAEEKIARARIELARRREQIGSAAGTDQLAKFSNELAMQAIDMAEKKAMLEIVSDQLNRTEQQLTASTILDPQVSQMRMLTQALEIAERRVTESNARLVNLQLPTVSVLGGE